MVVDDSKKGAKGESNPRPLAPEARIIPLDHWPLLYEYKRYSSPGSNRGPTAC